MTSFSFYMCYFVLLYSRDFLVWPGKPLTEADNDRKCVADCSHFLNAALNATGKYVI